jgi:hypothetical protein
MSRTILSLWHRRRKHEPSGPPGPGWRRINGQWFYSSAWLGDETGRRFEEETTR